MSNGRIAISEVTTEAWNFAEDIRAYGEADGVDGIGVWRSVRSSTPGSTRH